ncbi:hypothetical protein [Arthrobacter sp. NPDC057009]|uniref:hypothetical protein n=1 Tax=Arthrobacter sp. NPDC057009 TaxID=3345996 RepID=UPI00363B9A80
MIERAVDFERLRWMRCGTCSNEWRAHAEWLSRFHQGHERCPKCGTNCEAERRPDFWAAQDDPSHDDSTVLDTFWYHTTTHANWPDRAFNPTANLTDVTKRRLQAIGADGRGLERWAARQKAKALHLGTYEAAIENMLRRMTDQDGVDERFYLYRVRLRRDASLEPGVHPERADMMGDVQLAELGEAGIDILRYVNTHEDPSSVSLAVRFEAILAVQVIPIPLPVTRADAWVSTAAARLLDAAARPAPEPKTRLERMQRHRPSALSIEASKLEEEVADTLPFGIRDRFHRLYNEKNLTAEPAAFPSKLVGLAALVNDPRAVFEFLETVPWRGVAPLRAG